MQIEVVDYFICEFRIIEICERSMQRIDFNEVTQCEILKNQI